jgi:heparan-alpha-glucosaminide N-acetyltransferase
VSAPVGRLIRPPSCFLSQGGLHENGKYANCTGGITGYIDRLIFSERHLYKYPTCKAVYGRMCGLAGEVLDFVYLECGTFDPENLFGALPTMFLAYLGIQAGRILGTVRSRCVIVAQNIVGLVSSDV